MIRSRQIISDWVKSFLNLLDLSDKNFTEILYIFRQRRLLHLNPPRTFNEKMQWLKLFGSSEQYSNLVDKYAVREYITKKIGSQYLNELYGIYRNENEIDFNDLPQEFVLKPTHGSGWIILCINKSKMDIVATRKQLAGWIRTSYYRQERETCYKNITPRIVCERLLNDEKQNGITDFKFFCFYGHAKFIQINFDRYIRQSINYYDMNWEKLPMRLARYPTKLVKLEKPENAEKMKEIAENSGGRNTIC